MTLWRHFCTVLLLGTALSFAGCANTHTQQQKDSTAKKVESHYRLGLDALRKNNLPKAFDELLHAEHLDPKRADVLGALAYAWQLRGDMDKSHLYYSRALTIDPSSRTYNNFGGLLLSMHKPVEAEAAFRKTLNDPRYNRPALAYINLGDALLMQDRMQDAIAAYRQARLLNPQQEISRLKEAATYLKYKRPAFARAMYETILRDSPGKRQALEGLLPLLSAQQDKDEAMRQLRLFIKQTPVPLDRAWAEESLQAMQP